MKKSAYRTAPPAPKTKINGVYATELPEYYVWVTMRQRCCDPRNHRYPLYGGRGVRVCERWLQSFLAFYEDMGPRPSAEHSIDRYPKNDGNYEPGNCRWATQREQTRNYSRNRYLEHRGERKLLKDWADELGTSSGAISNYLKRGHTFAKFIERRAAR